METSYPTAERGLLRICNDLWEGFTIFGFTYFAQIEILLREIVL